MGSATSAADKPRFTAPGASFTRREAFCLPFAAVFFFAAMVDPSTFIAEDDARATRVREISPGPVDEHDDPVAEADEEEHVDEEPEPPRDGARKTELRELHDGEVAPDGRERAEIAVDERTRRSAPDARGDVVGGARSHLLRGGGNAGNRLPVLLHARE